MSGMTPMLANEFNKFNISCMQPNPIIVHSWPWTSTEEHSRVNVGSGICSRLHAHNCFPKHAIQTAPQIMHR